MSGAPAGARLTAQSTLQDSGASGAGACAAPKGGSSLEPAAFGESCAFSVFISVVPAGVGDFSVAELD